MTEERITHTVKSRTRLASLWPWVRLPQESSLFPQSGFWEMDYWPAIIIAMKLAITTYWQKECCYSTIAPYTAYSDQSKHSKRMHPFPTNMSCELYIAYKTTAGHARLELRYHPEEKPDMQPSSCMVKACASIQWNLSIVTIHLWDTREVIPLPNS